VNLADPSRVEGIDALLEPFTAGVVPAALAEVIVEDG